MWMFIRGIEYYYKSYLITDSADDPGIYPHLCDFWEGWGSRGKDWSGREAYGTAVPDSWVAGMQHGKSVWSVIICSPNLINSDWQTQLTIHESTLALLKSEKDELAGEKSGLEEELAILKSQTHELQVE